MSAAVAARAGSEPWPWLRRAGPLALLLAGTLALGVAGQSAARLLFIAGCVGVAWDLLRFGAAAHFSGSLVLFCLAPFLRRVVDAHVGYEASGIMISGPLLAILVPAPRLLAELASGRPPDPALRPFLLASACTLYGTVLTIVDGNLMQAASGALKWASPLIYGMWLYGEARRQPDLLEAATRTLMLLMPLLGVYGFLQYLDPPVWDRYWMTYTTIASIGQPEPYMIRVFSTMNAPAGYATFTAAALLMFGFRKPRPALLLAAAPAVLGLMLSLYRTAWIALAAGVVLGLFHRRTRKRASVLLVAIGLLGTGVVTLTPAGQVIERRLMSFGAVSEDSSGQERLAEYAELLNADGGTLLGHGFGATDVMQAGALALDGQLIISWYTMGLVVGMLCVAAVCWAAVQAMRNAWRSGTVSSITVAGIMFGALVQMPLAAVSASETGALFWSLAAIGAAARPRRPATPT